MTGSCASVCGIGMEVIFFPIISRLLLTEKQEGKPAT